MPRRKNAVASQEDDEEVEATQRGSSKKASSSKKVVEEEEMVEEEDTQSTQATQGGRGQKALAKLSQAEIKTKTAELVRCILFTASTGTPINLGSEQFKKIFEKYPNIKTSILGLARAELRMCFGMDLEELPPNEGKDEPAMPLDKVPDKAHRKTGNYALFNIITAPPDNVRAATGDRFEHVQEMVQSDNDAPASGLLLSVLSVIHMNSGELNEDSIWSFLKKLGIEKKKLHPIFGDVQEKLSEFERQRYLQKLKHVEADASVFDYRWGSKARAEISDHAILSFIATIYGDHVAVWMNRMGRPIDSLEDAD